MQIVPAQTLSGKVEGLYLAGGKDFVTAASPQLALDYEGIVGDVHAGLVRKSGSREPWYKRGTQMRNERQISLLSQAELDEVAQTLQIEQVLPEWIGGNLLVSGIPAFSLLPPRTILMFEGGVSIRIDGDNGPCRLAGRSIAANVADRPDIEFGFVKAAKRKRGLVGWVERPGTIAVGETFSARIWEQVIYQPQDLVAR